MKKPRRFIKPNWDLRWELIKKGFIIPPELVPEWLLKKGFPHAAEAAAQTRGRKLRYDTV